MQTSSASSRTKPSFHLSRPGWPSVAGIFTATALTTLYFALSTRHDNLAARAAHGQGRPLFAGWIQPGGADFGQAMRDDKANAPQAKWVLAIEPGPAGHPDLQGLLPAQAPLHDLAPAPSWPPQPARLVSAPRVKPQPDAAHMDAAGHALLDTHTTATTP